ncbi:MAG: winged helix-turn-helix transcriptional regulator [Candidatus Cloacimonetes bacterium]|nr:winged helix-turn-helix transcriptional regulator [Candidatus Cloacimonadota bacterium]MBT4331648.1 winged helix-turn-helix transcriptional regulator [Candidatus Cloacimonadota bacterium]MBT4575609.1 winged helix-turn-helix transcriptional regulator [Candidatus Cloacimonadota bacterium]MBT5420193.1 winged helix-turn-helix transcriptional regulator [Candidatus Cloacimonadota bacterium]
MVNDKLFKALSDANRRKIIDLLKKKEMTAGEIAENFSVSKPTISEHLKTLKNADLIQSEKNGQFITYFLNTSVLEDMLSYMITIFGKKENNDE